MNKDLTEIAMVLDRSGSMSSMAAEAIGGYNSFLESQQKLPGQAKLTLVLFDHEYIVEHDGRSIIDVPALNETTYVPRGTTALLNTACRAARSIGWVYERRE